MVQPIKVGNIDLTNRPVVQNEDNTISTVRSMSIGTDEGEVLIPTVVDGKVVSEEEAIAAYEKSGQHLGIFSTPEDATSYAEQLHKDQEAMYSTPSVQVDPAEANKNPWDMDWGISEFVSPTQPAEVSMSPWDMDWGLKEAMTVIPKTIQKGVTAMRDGMQSLSFDTVFNKLVGAESGGRHTDASGKLLKSSEGALGVTQVMRKTGADPGYGVAPLKNQSKEEYIRFGKDYLQAMLKNYNGDYRKAVAAYNAGPGSVDKAITKAEEKGGDWTQYLPKKSETIPYMDKILGTVEGRLNNA